MTVPMAQQGAGIGRVIVQAADQALPIVPNIFSLLQQRTRVGVERR